MRIPGIKTAKSFSRWLQARFLGGALILGYHRIERLAQDEYEVCVTPQHFAEQMEILSKHAHPVSLRELVKGLKEGSVQPGSVAVTFDDGYVQNLYQAKPILEKYAIPAIVFVCTGYAGKEFWWDELVRLVASTEADMDALCLKAGGTRFVWNQASGRPAAAPNARRMFRQALYRFLLTLDVEEQNHAMNTIRSWSEVAPIETTERAMTCDELIRIVDHGLIELGAHTRHHPMLPQLSPGRQRQEIISSKRDLEILLNRQVHGFAYPNGGETDDTKRFVREAGFSFACTSLQDVVRHAHDLHALPRFWQRDVNGEKFLQALHLWMKDGWA
jgi:peptidoglycan/xylan/chitin deacetylase (PgdA/CDA1 family)